MDGALGQIEQDRKPDPGNPLTLRFRRMSLMIRLFLLVFIAVLPAIAIQAYNEYDLRKAREDEIRQQVVQITKQFGEEMGELREGARQLLVALGQLPAVKFRDAESCSALFASLKRQYANYNILGAADAEGHVFCASAPTAYASVADQIFFKRAMAQDGLAVGNYWADPVTGAKTIHFAQRIYDEDGTPLGVTFAGLSLEWLSEHLKERGLSPSASILIADREGNIIARLPHPEQLVGKNMRKSHEAIMDGDKAGWEEAAGVDGAVRIFGYVPAQLPPRDFFLSAGLSKAEAFAAIDNATLRGIGLIAVGFVLAIYAAWLGGRVFIQRPIGGLLAVTTQWRNGNLGARVHLRDVGSEIGRLGLAFNDMADALAARHAAQKLAEENLRRLNATLEEHVEQRTQELASANLLLKEEINERERAQAALLQAQKIEAIGQLTSGIAHDFNNLLTAILGNLEVARRRLTDPRALKVLDTATRAARRGAKLVGDLLAFSRRQRLQLKPVDVNALISKMDDLLDRSIGSIVQIERSLEAETWPALADAGQVELAILNLAINARDAMPSGGTLTVSTANVPSGDPRLPEELAGEFVMIAVRDTGTGMSEEVRAKVFEPFFTTKEVGKGSGLGLSMVYGLAKQCGGSVKIDSRIGEGTTVSMFFPRAVALEEAAPEGEASGLVRAKLEAHRLGAKVLVVDDDAEVREFAASALSDVGYVVYAAENGQRALEILARERDIDLLITDFAMPVMTGTELIQKVRKHWPGLPVMLISGVTNLPAAELATAQAQLLRKPFDVTELVSAVSGALVSAEATPPAPRILTVVSGGA